VLTTALDIRDVSERRDLHRRAMRDLRAIPELAVRVVAPRGDGAGAVDGGGTTGGQWQTESSQHCGRDDEDGALTGHGGLPATRTGRQNLTPPVAGFLT
jgi:hypothetical protein